MAYDYQFRGLYLEDFEIGREYLSPARTVTEADVVNFAGLSGEFNPLHTDEEFAKANSFGTRIAHGALGFTKHLRIRDAQVAEATPPSDEKMQKLKAIMEEYGLNTIIH